MNAKGSSGSGSNAGYKGIPVQRLLDDEERERPVPWVLRQESFIDFGTGGIDPARYTSLEFHRLEVEHVWNKVWQLACFEQDIPNVGDHVIYALGDREVIVVRSSPDTIQAFPNSCLHRGRALCDHDGNSPELRCPFHGFTWSIDGSFKGVPPSVEWDYGHIDRDAFHLPEIRCATSDGMIFVNFDNDAPELETYLGDFPKHMERWPIAGRLKVAHVAKVLNCNWKVALEAFIEVYHVGVTHPHTAPSGDGSNCEYDTYPGQHFNRMIAPNFLGNNSLSTPLSQQEMLEAMIAASAAVGEPAMRHMVLGDGEQLGKVVANAERAALDRAGVDGSRLTDIELTSSLQYYLFPNIMPWARPLFYRWRPHGDDPHRCVMEIMLLVPWTENSPRPPPAQIRWLAEDEAWSQATELGVLGAIADQDGANMEAVQRGLRNLQRPITLGRYVDSRIRHYHSMLDEYIEREGGTNAD